MVGNTLGCAREYTVELYWVPRDADPVRMWLRTTLTGVARVRWGRTLNGTSTAEVQINPAKLTGDCGRILAQVDPWRWEIRIKREGVAVWEGPVTSDVQSTSMTEPFVLRAADVSVWLDRQSSLWPFSYTTPTDVAVIARDALVEALGENEQYPWPPDNQMILPWLRVLPTGFAVTYDHPFEDLGRDSLLDMLDQLTDLGLDWTTIQRSMYLTRRDNTDDLPLTRLSQQDFTGPAELEQDGEDMVTVVTIKSPTSFSRAGSTGGPYGRHVGSINLSAGEALEPSRRAGEMLSGRRTPVAVITTPDGALRPGTAWPVERMIPGRRVDLVATIGEARTFSQPRILADVDVDWVPGSIETVKVALIPAADAVPDPETA